MKDINPTLKLAHLKFLLVKKLGFVDIVKTKFEFDEGRYYVNNYPVYSRMFCPICGHISLDSEIRYSSVEGKYLPYVVILKILEMKSKVIFKNRI